VSEMIDRVARAINEVNPWVGIAWMDLPSVPKDEYRAKARAAIEAMREPTEGMLDRLDAANSGWGTREHSKELWQELIDEALERSQS
jgi:hypothetical protein